MHGQLMLTFDSVGDLLLSWSHDSNIGNMFAVCLLYIIGFRDKGTDHILR